MRRHVGFYVHHHGCGHTSRTQALIAALDLPATVLTSATHDAATFGHADVVALPRDDGPSDGDPTRWRDVATPAHLHYGPLGIKGLRDRVARTTTFLATTNPALLVVDVSCEVAQLARIASVPTVVVRQHGARWDAAHMAAYDAAIGLLAPFGPELEEPTVPADVRAKTFYAGGLARNITPPETRPNRDDIRTTWGWDAATTGVVVLQGGARAGPSSQDLEAAAEATPEHRWAVIGDSRCRPHGVRVSGWVDNPLAWLAAGDVVVGSAGHNTVMEAALVQRPFICVPEDRPFDEQRHKADRLRALDAAEVVDAWPAPGDWPATIQRARQRDPSRLARLVDPAASRRAADWLTSLVDRFAA